MAGHFFFRSLGFLEKNLSYLLYMVSEGGRGDKPRFDACDKTSLSNSQSVGIHLCR